MPALTDVTGDRPFCMSKAKEESFLPVISSNRSSQSSNQGDSPHNPYVFQSELEKFSTTSSHACSVAESLRLPTIDRSKTNSICSLSSNATNTSKAKRTNSFRLSHQQDLCRSPSCPNLTDFDIFTEDEWRCSPLSDKSQDIKTNSDHHLSGSIKLPNIGKCTNDHVSSRRSNVNNNNADKPINENEKLYDNNDTALLSFVDSTLNLSKQKSSSMSTVRDVDKLARSSMGSGKLSTAESLNSVHVQGSQKPLLCPLRQIGSRASQKQRKQKIKKPKKLSRLGSDQTVTSDKFTVQIPQFSNKVTPVMNGPRESHVNEPRTRHTMKSQPSSATIKPTKQNSS